MSRSKGPFTIGIVSLATPKWNAGGTFTGVVARALAGAVDPARERVVWIAAEGTTAPDGLDLVALRDPGPRLATRLLRQLSPALNRAGARVPGAFAARARLGLLDPGSALAAARAAGVDVVAPLYTEVPPAGIGVGSVAWIPDFQHRFLPEFFSPEEVAARSVHHAALAARCERVLLSSEDVRTHFVRFHPEHADKARVAHFPSRFAWEPPSGDPRGVTAKYHLPEKFALVVNQFWAHKNHSLVVQAIAQAAARGLRVPVVMTGRPADARDPSNGTVSRLLQDIARAGLTNEVRVLGEVPFADLTSLLRTAALVIQPSRFEGWSTTIEDARALGRPVACSDLGVHREQAPDAVGFFGCDAPEALAALLVDRWAGLAAGPESGARGRGAGERGPLGEAVRRAPPVDLPRGSAFIMSTPSISVIVPAPPGGDIEPALRSIVTQGSTSVEVIVIDGGDPAAIDTTITRTGLASAVRASLPGALLPRLLEEGLRRATGDVLAWLGGRDTHLPWTLRAAGEIFAAFPDIAWISSLRPAAVDASLVSTGVPTIPGFAREAFLDGRFLAPSAIQAPATFFRRSLWDRAGARLDPIAPADFDLWARFYLEADLVGVTIPLAVSPARAPDPAADHAHRAAAERSLALIRARLGHRPRPARAAAIGLGLAQLPRIGDRVAARFGYAGRQLLRPWTGPNTGRWLLVEHAFP
ncbi:MAG: glycosyltransferase [Minicystis sp.]